MLRGLWQRRVDLSIARAFKLGGTTDVEMRWDIFNLFNTVNYALPENVIGEPGPTSARSPTPSAVRG